MKRITLDPEQQQAVDRMVHEPSRAALNASQYGTGKTVVTVEVAEAVAPLGVKLIVAPLFTKYSWQSTILGQYPHSVVKFINSTKAGKSALQDLVSATPGWYIIGRELFRTKNITNMIAPISNKIDFMAYDECAAWANYKSQGFANMKKMKPAYKMALSATPGGNKFTGLYAITQWLWPKLDGHASYWKFVAEWCDTELDFYAGLTVKGEKQPGQFVKHLPCYVRLEKDFGEPIEFRIEVELSSQERKLYSQMERNMIVWLQEHPLVVKFPFVKRMRLRQMTLGEVSYNHETEEVFFSKDMRSTKYDTLLSILNEYPEEQTLILTHSAKFAEVVALKLREAGINALPWTGRVTEDIRHMMKEAFISGDLTHIVATMDSIGEGVDGLQKASRMMIWLSKSDNNQLNEQAFRRLFRRGQERQVVSVNIIAKDTYDDGQLSNLIQQTIAMNASLQKGE